MKIGYGPHLLADCFGCDFNRLNDIEFCKKFLDDMTQKIGMKKIDGPHVLRYDPPHDVTDSGVTGVVIISTSHCSIHTYPYIQGFAFIDVFSCKPFDTELAIDFIRESFKVKPEDIEHQVVWRGARFEKYA